MRYRNATAYRFLTPYLLVFAIFWIWPIISSFLISFQATRTVPWRFAPAFNWGRLIGDPAFFNALKNTLLVLVPVPSELPLATVVSMFTCVPVKTPSPLSNPVPPVVKFTMLLDGACHLYQIDLPPEIPP